MRHIINVRIPPATDVEGLTNLYLQLLSARGVMHHCHVNGSAIFDHPIPESRELLLTEIDNHSAVLGSLSLRYGQIELVSAVCNDRTMTMVLECTKPNQDFENVRFANID